MAVLHAVERLHGVGRLVVVVEGDEAVAFAAILLVVPDTVHLPPKII